MALVSFRDVTFGFVNPPLLEHVELQIERGERIGLLGRNGAGKSTLMKLVMGELSPDDGTVDRQSGLRVARLVQDVPVGHGGSIFEEVAQGLGDVADAVVAGHQLHHASPTLSESARAKLSHLAHSRADEAVWQGEHRVDVILERMKLDPHAPFASLSSGMKRRVLLAKALVLDPDMLLLDEPTNHLDIDAIQWLEEFLRERFSGTLLFVTHDRVFLQKLANRIVELDRGRLFDWPCDYQTFLVRKEAALDAEEQQQALFDKKLAREEIWIRKGVKARNVRNMGRVRALMKMREERAARREKVGNVSFAVQEAERSGRLVVDVKEATYAYPAGKAPDSTSPVDQSEPRTIIRELTTTIMRGDKVGIIGPNGCGKTTLIRLLLGELAPQSGNVRLGTNIEVAYFDQLRATIDDTKTVAQNVSPGSDKLVINGQQKHILGYLEDFLFAPERSRSPARHLSGGERNRLLLARLFSKPSNVLVLDEPTNDLDAETLELLENLIVEYSGTVLLVSHDRAFLNEVVTQTLVFEGNGYIKEYAGGYDDWIRQRDSARQSDGETRSESGKKKGQSEFAQASATSTSKSSPAKETRQRKMSFKEQKELAELPKRIEQLEIEQQKLNEAMALPNFFQQDKATIALATQRMEAIQQELTKVFERWEELEAMKN